MTDDVKEAWIQQAKVAAEQHMTGVGAGHDFDHVRRVHACAVRLVDACGGDKGRREVDSCVVRLAAWLHDIGDAKFHDGQELTAQLAEQIMLEAGVQSDVCGHVVEIVDNMSFRKRQHARPLTFEGKLVQDADRLDALGAVGIVRTIEYGQAKSQPFYLPGFSLEEHESSSMPTGVGHFFEKLFLLPELMNTEVGRQEAESRVVFMRGFLKQFFSELEH